MLLFLLFDLLNDLPDLPLCSLLETRRMQYEGLIGKQKVISPAAVIKPVPN